MGYPTDLNDAEWAVLEPLFPPARTGRPRTHPTRVIVNAILYVLRTGCQWRLLPNDLLPWPSVHYYVRKWRDDGTWERAARAAAAQAAAARTGTRTQRRGDRQLIG
jgi:putative transposase